MHHTVFFFVDLSVRAVEFKCSCRIKLIGPLLAHLRQNCYSMMCLHPQLQRFDIGWPISVVPTLSVKQAGATEGDFSMPHQIGTTEMSLPGCSHLLYVEGGNSTSVMQIISNSFCEISSGELQITCTKNIIRNHTLVLHVASMIKQLRMRSFSGGSLHQKRA